MTASKQQHDGGLARIRKSPGPLQPSAPTAATGWEGWRIALQPIPDLVGWYKEHKVSGTLLITAFVIVKGFVIARGDITNALAIVQYAGVVGWAAAAVLSSLPLIAAAMLAISCYQVFWPLSGGLRFASWGQQLPVVVVAFLICAALAPAYFSVGAAVLGFLFGGVQWGINWLDRRVETRGGRLFADWGIWFVRLVIWASALSAVIAMLYVAWLPNEIVTFKKHNGKGPPQRVAYVLAEDSGGWITLLDSHERRIIRYKDARVRKISECRLVPHGGFSDVTEASTLWALITHKWLPRFHPALSNGCQTNGTPWPKMRVLVALPVIVIVLAGITVGVSRFRGHRANHAPTGRPYGRWPGRRKWSWASVISAVTRRILGWPDKALRALYTYERRDTPSTEPRQDIPT